MMINRLVALSSEKFNSDSNRLEEEVQEKKILQEFYSYPLEYQVIRVTRR